MSLKARLLLKVDAFKYYLYIPQANIAIFKSRWLFEFIFVNSIKYQVRDARTL